MDDSLLQFGGSNFAERNIIPTTFEDSQIEKFSSVSENENEIQQSLSRDNSKLPGAFLLFLTVIFRNNPFSIVTSVSINLTHVTNSIIFEFLRSPTSSFASIPSFHILDSRTMW